ncbi:MAG: 2-hydroxyacyl-CoA dehydratase [Oscillospiraceae bacterium]|nr:2-hydroxyacyl-CoA dehydratase [Oscillospiraceae bacterium]
MAEIIRDETGRVLFTEEMKKEYTILCPNMLEIHFRILVNIFNAFGYHAELLTTTNSNIAQEGLKYVHNDTCYPALLVIGQFIDALNSGKYDVDKVALLITQSGGGCRASNYIHLLRKALINAGYPNVPVVSLNLSGLEKNPGFKFTLPLMRRFLAGLVYGDLLMLLDNQVKPYEVHKGDSAALVEKWVKGLSVMLRDGRGIKQDDMVKVLDRIVKEFSEIEIQKVPKVKVGIVGEIYVKYAPFANNELEKFLYEQDCEVNLPGLMNFLLFKVDNRIEDIKLYGGNLAKKTVIKALFDYMAKLQNMMIDAVKKQPKFQAPANYDHVKKLVDGVIGYGNKMGEGWLLTAEMLELIECGFENIVCAQPFGCLPNHICGKGMIHKIKKIDDRANIVPIDYDPSATRVNQENRIKLMLAVAREKLNTQQEQKDA